MSTLSTGSRTGLRNEPLRGLFRMSQAKPWMRFCVLHRFQPPPVAKRGAIGAQMRVKEFVENNLEYNPRTIASL